MVTPSLGSLSDVAAVKFKEFLAGKKFDLAMLQQYANSLSNLISKNLPNIYPSQGTHVVVILGGTSDQFEGQSSCYTADGYCSSMQHLVGSEFQCLVNIYACDLSKLTIAKLEPESKFNEAYFKSLFKKYFDAKVLTMPKIDKKSAFAYEAEEKALATAFGGIKYGLYDEFKASGISENFLFDYYICLSTKTPGSAMGAAFNGRDCDSFVAQTYETPEYLCHLCIYSFKKK